MSAVVGRVRCKAVRHTLDEFSGSVHSFTEAATCGTGSRSPEKEDKMNKDKNLQFCIDALQSMRNRNGLEPGQRSALEKAEDEVKRLWRKPNPTRREIFIAVRKVAEAIIENFVG